MGEGESIDHYPRPLRPDEELRIVAGIVIQPFLALVVTFFGFRLLRLDPSGATLDSLTDATHAAIGVALGTAIVAFFIALILALPTALWLMKRHPVTWSEAIAFGLLFGNLPFVAGTYLAGSYGFEGFIRGVALSSLLGASGASAFWAIALRTPSSEAPKSVPRV